MLLLCLCCASAVSRLCLVCPRCLMGGVPCCAIAVPSTMPRVPRFMLLRCLCCASAVSRLCLVSHLFSLNDYVRRILSLGHSGLGHSLVASRVLASSGLVGLGLGLLASKTSQGIDPRGSCALQWPRASRAVDSRLEAGLVLDDLDEARHCVDAQVGVFSSAPGLDHSLRIFHGLATDSVSVRARPETKRLRHQQIVLDSTQKGYQTSLMTLSCCWG